jgi:acetoin utilization deacetylase AcuC-like enzyme
MRTFFHPEQLLHYPRSYYSRGQMRTPQEVPERAQNLLLAAQTIGFDIQQPQDYGLDPLLAVHGAPYLTFLQEAHQRWKEIPEDWGDEVMSNIFVREPNALRGILAKQRATWPMVVAQSANSPGAQLIGRHKAL